MKNLTKVSREIAMSTKGKIVSSYQGLSVTSHLIPYDKNFAYTRYFVEYLEDDGSITDIGNYETEEQANEVFVEYARRMVGSK